MNCAGPTWYRTTETQDTGLRTIGTQDTVLQSHMNDTGIPDHIVQDQGPPGIQDYRTTWHWTTDRTTVKWYSTRETQDTGLQDHRNTRYSTIGPHKWYRATGPHSTGPRTTVVYRTIGPHGTELQDNMVQDYKILMVQGHMSPPPCLEVNSERGPKTNYYGYSYPSLFMCCLRLKGDVP